MYTYTYVTEISCIAFCVSWSKYSLRLDTSKCDKNASFVTKTNDFGLDVSRSW